MSESSFHKPVMVREVLEHLLTRTDGVYVDATLGGGGHAEAILERLDKNGKLIGLDADVDAIKSAGERLKGYGDRVTLVNENFKNLRAALTAPGVKEVSGVLFDLGVSSFQLDEASKGFSFRADERLDMRMNRSQALDAQAVVNTYDEQRLIEIIKFYGEERNAKRIARAIMHVREKQKIETTGQLADVVEAVTGNRFRTKSLARVFQAIRIEVNNELEHLQQALLEAVETVERNGRIVVISYHSLEDRIVKQMFKTESATTIPSAHKLVPDTRVSPRLSVVTKKPVVPTDIEQAENPRARSAKMRAAEKL
ncbi:MAG: 16S rRNA (cytosine(1402)-N(4))-methyltransferase RsmH [Ignavibacteriae bacterium]|nr:16S rRNA (cytosine(1402)-N(4))-methyltransferase RsmH [Ignavibacteriota bacterium]